MATKQEKMEAFGQLLDILDELRVKCPWDQANERKSSHEYDRRDLRIMRCHHER